jgi:hypothetical protein
MRSDGPDAKPAPAAAPWLPAVILLTPWLVFVRHNGYPLFHLDVLAGAVVIGAFGLTLGIIGRYGRAAASCATALAVVLFVDLQYDPQLPIQGVGETAVLLLSGMAITAVLLAAGRPAQLVVGLMACSALVTSAFVPGGRLTYSESTSVTPDTEQPFLLHLILDEHIGPSGLRSAGRAEDASRLTGEYGRLGFEIFDAAYSEHDATFRSLGHLFNLASGDLMNGLVETGTSPFSYQLTGSRYLQSLTRAGYAVSVYQTDHLNLCHGTPGVAGCHTYPAARLGVLVHTDLPLPGRLRVLGSVFLGQSDLWEEAGEAFGRVGSLQPPSRGGDDTRVSAISATLMLDAVERDLGDARRGEALIAHVLLPHSPYVYGEGCRMRPPGEWLRRLEQWEPEGNSFEARQRRYALYSEQLACTQRRIERLLNVIPAAVSSDAVVVIHGDHGSRIVRSSSRTAPSVSADDLDRYSTLFAVRSPSVTPTRHERPASVQCLFAALLAGGFSLETLSSCEGPALVQIPQGGNSKAEKIEGLESLHDAK